MHPWWINILLHFTDGEEMYGVIDRERIKVLGTNRLYMVVQRRDGRYSVLNMLIG